LSFDYRYFVSRVKAHKLIHTGHKPVFQCELCPTTCGRKTDLKYHVMKLHTSDRPLQCRKCGKAFPDRYTYKVLPPAIQRDDNNDNCDNVYGAVVMTKVVARVHPVHLMNVD